MDFAPPETLFDEITDFLLSAPTPHAIIAFKPSEALNDRLDELLSLNESDLLSSEGHQELAQFLQFNHLLTLLKAKARLKLLEG